MVAKDVRHICIGAVKICEIGEQVAVEVIRQNAGEVGRFISGLTKHQTLCTGCAHGVGVYLNAARKH